jgi:phosphatidylinositol alpha-mannosyltransferase
MVLVAERLLDLVTLTGVALVAAPAISRLLPAPAIPAPDPTVLVLLGGAVLLAAAGLMALIRAFGLATRTPAGVALVSRLISLYRDIRVVTSPDRKRLLWMIGWTALAWGGTLLLHYLLFGAIGVSGSLALAVAVTLSTNLSMLLPASPANIGIFHAAAAAPLMASGISADLSVAYAVLAHAVNTLPPIVIGLACLVATRDLLPGRLRPTP